MNNWSELPEELVWKICKRLELYEDVAAFRGVCQWWRNCATKTELKGRVKLPLLMLAQSKNNQVQEVYSLSKRIVHRLVVPGIEGTKVFSSQGWFITLKKDLTMQLLHPFTRAQIQLPSLDTISDWKSIEKRSTRENNFVRKVTLSIPPLSEEEEECIVVIIYGSKSEAAFCRPGEKRWINIAIWGLRDVTYHQKKFYLVDWVGKVFVCNFVGGQNCTVHRVGRLIIYSAIMDNWYIVGSTESSLFLVGCCGKNSHGGRYELRSFKVFEMQTRDGEWHQVYDLEKKTIFVGTSSTVLVAQNSKIIPNSIYFTGEGGDTYMGVYSMQILKFVSKWSDKSSSTTNLPMWIVPS